MSFRIPKVCRAMSGLGFGMFSFRSCVRFSNYFKKLSFCDVGGAYLLRAVQAIICACDHDGDINDARGILCRMEAV